MFGKSVNVKDRNSASFYEAYSIVRELGSGGSGTVYLAWHKRLCKYVVLKNVPCCSSAMPELHRNEVEALKDVKCAYIPQVLDFYMDSDSSSTVLEYIEGESFDKLLKQKNVFPATQLSKWFYQLASALAAIHSHDICHRDIKPANIILTPCGDACLIDFNSALVSGNNAGVISRSRAYASPEQYAYFRLCDAIAKRKSYRSKKSTAHFSTIVDCNTELIAEKEVAYRPSIHNIDWKLSDIYSLGATMYHLLLRIRPPDLLCENIVFPMLEHELGSIKDIIARCMKINPMERFTSADELCIAAQNLFT